MNELLRLSRGRYFTWLADDDLYDPSLLSTIANTIEQFNKPNVVFTSFSDFRDNAVPPTETAEPEIRLISGRDFIRGYLSHQIKAIGVMGFFFTDYLKALGGLEDVSRDGMGLYCEYMILIRCGLLDRIGYVNAPLVFYRIHEGAWGILNCNLEQYDRAAKNLLTSSAEIFATKNLEHDFTYNTKQLLKRVMIQYVNVARASSEFGVRDLLTYLAKVRRYITDKPGKRFYRKGLVALAEAEIWIVSVLVWRKFLGTAPSRLIGFAQFVQSRMRGKRQAKLLQQPDRD
jgi:hypothetical protein